MAYSKEAKETIDKNFKYSIDNIPEDLSYIIKITVCYMDILSHYDDLSTDDEDRMIKSLKQCSSVIQSSVDNLANLRKELFHIKENNV